MYIPCRFPKWENQQITFRGCAETSHQAPKEEPTFHGSSRRSKALSNLCESTINQVSTIYINHFVISIFIDEIPIILVYIPIKYKFISPLSQVLEG